MSVDSSPMYPLGTGVFGTATDIKPVADTAAAGTSTMVPRADHQHAGVTTTSYNYFPPIGAVLPWAKSITATPALPIGWQECNGAAINNALSPMNGQNTPNLNNTPRFIRGPATSGGTGGADTVALSIAEMPAHNHTYSNLTGSGANGGTPAANLNTAAITGTSGSGTAHNNLPAYMSMVYIIRIY